MTESTINEDSLKQELAEILNDKIISANNFDISIKKTKLVMSGGGVKGIAHVGGLKALSEMGILENIDTFAGTSIGGFIAALVVIGYSYEELYDIISGIDLNKMKKRINFDNLLKLFGLDDGTGMEIVLEKMFKAKGFNPGINFLELYNKTGKTLIISTSCLNDKKAYYYSHTTFPEMGVIMAIRMSISIPLYFTPVRYKGKTFVDGGCIDNYPIQLFNHCLDEVIGLYLTDIRDNIEDIKNIEDLLIHIMECLFEGITCNSLKGYEKYSVKISLKQVSVIDFHIDQLTKKKLFDTGYEAVRSKFNIY